METLLVESERKIARYRKKDCVVRGGRDFVRFRKCYLETSSMLIIKRLETITTSMLHAADCKFRCPRKYLCQGSGQTSHNPPNKPDHLKRGCIIGVIMGGPGNMGGPAAYGWCIPIAAPGGIPSSPGCIPMWGGRIMPMLPPIMAG